MPPEKPFMSTWTVYWNPRDYPGKYVARRWDIFHGRVEPQPTSIGFVADSLDAIRQRIPPGLACLPRFDDDDHCIVEVWL